MLPAIFCRVLLFASILELHLIGIHGETQTSERIATPCNIVRCGFITCPISTASKITQRQRSLQHYSNFNTRCASASTPIPELFSVDVRYNRRSPLTYDPSSGRYLDVATTELSPDHRSNDNPKINIVSQFLQSAFVPEGVAPSYYSFMRWRILQRFVNANVHVIGTQSLLMGLRGMHRGNGGGGPGAVATGAAAATNWVLKDTLGKIVRMGKQFDLLRWHASFLS
eukprot:CCRYP_014142-RC/>CCRYP_014142-RC protein AED:0.21 eAED:0.21 QI:385/1/1/1/1/1/2/587/225